MLPLVVLLRRWRLAAAAALIVVAVASVGVAHHESVAAARARSDLAAARTEIATIRADAARDEAALATTAARDQARAVADAELRSRIHALPSTTICSRSPAVRAVLDRVRDDQRAAAASAGPRGAADVRP